VEQSNSARPVALYLTSPNTNAEVAVGLLRRAIVANLYATPSPYSYEQPPDYPAANELASRPLTVQYTEALGGVSADLLDNQRTQFGADVEESVSAYVEDVAYHLMLICFLGVLDGNSEAFRWLTALMVRGGPNRQLTISRFLNMTTGLIRSPQEDLPDSEEDLPDSEFRFRWIPPDSVTVFQWVAAASTNPSLESVLPNLVAEYISRVHNVS
jgi:hypothetical protein